VGSPADTQDLRRVPREDEEPLKQVNVALPVSLDGWLSIYAAQRNAAKGPDDPRVTKSSIIRALVAAERARVEPAAHG
jgi:hypothetical protein